jgi:uncharacterized protein YdhG (YjbR/CyaY superfamily)
MQRKPKITDIDSYIKTFPGDVQEILRKVRKTIRQAAPKAEESISYMMPAFRLNGSPLIYFAAWNSHMSLYPTGSTMVSSLPGVAPYKASKGTLKFTFDKPVPYALIKKIVQFRVKETADKGSAKSGGSGLKARTNKNHVHRHKDGSVWGKGSLLKGEMVGYWEWFRKDGTKMRSGHFKGGKQVGEWTTYDKNGRVVKVTNKK